MHGMAMKWHHALTGCEWYTRYRGYSVRRSIFLSIIYRINTKRLSDRMQKRSSEVKPQQRGIYVLLEVVKGLWMEFDEVPTTHNGVFDKRNANVAPYLASVTLHIHPIPFPAK
jgi:hypothetical protein